MTLCPSHSDIRHADNLDDRNKKLFFAGQDIVVNEQGLSYDLLFPGDPGYWR